MYEPQRPRIRQWLADRAYHFFMMCFRYLLEHIIYIFSLCYHLILPWLFWIYIAANFAACVYKGNSSNGYMKIHIFFRH